MTWAFASSTLFRCCPTHSHTLRPARGLVLGSNVTLHVAAHAAPAPCRSAMHTEAELRSKQLRHARSEIGIVRSRTHRSLFSGSSRYLSVERSCSSSV